MKGIADQVRNDDHRGRHCGLDPQSPHAANDCVIAGDSGFRQNDDHRGRHCGLDPQSPPMTQSPQ